MKLLALALVFLAVPLARADSTTCFTPIPGWAFITTLPLCGSTPPLVPTSGDMQGNQNDQGENDDFDLDDVEPGTSFILPVPANDPAPTSTPEPATLSMLIAALASLMLYRRVKQST